MATAHTGQTGRLDGLLDEIRRQTARGSGPDARRIIDWLHRQTGAHAALIASDARTVEAAGPEFPHTVLRELAELIARVSGGRLAAAVTEAEGLHVRCEALGAPGPRPVLVVAGPPESAPETAALASHAGSVLTLLRRAGESDRTHRAYQRKARQVRLAVLHALMADGPVLARRMTSGAVPPLLEAERLRIHLLSCPSADRDHLTRLHEDPSGYHGPDLMVHCPVFKEHLICLVVEPDAPADTEGGDGAGLGEALRRLVRDNPRYALGVSGAHPLGATAEAYGQAAHALVAARTTPDRVALYHGRSPLVSVLPAQAAARWSRAVLRPLDEVPKTSGDIARLSLIMPRTGVARLLGLSRNTVTAHIRRTEQVLGQDLADVRCRAAVQLALALCSAPVRPAPDDDGPPPDLDDLLAAVPAAAWARTLLGRVRERHVRTLRAWVDADTDAQRAAHRLGVSRNTVRAHLRAAESALGLDLLTHGSGVHDVVHALRIAELHGL
ncbi:helix-turn-helix domain-containing protein [Streptomyces californicus]|uniref:helix-turn-helix domain-containing protein n=1 Tax=Streptomyces californicus TaxID=67351 RepID=UPI0037D08127